jgi:hypothetical protein
VVFGAKLERRQKSRAAGSSQYPVDVKYLRFYFKGMTILTSCVLFASLALVRMGAPIWCLASGS